MLIENYGVSSEAEVVSGHIRCIAQRQTGTLKHEYVDTVDIIRRHLESIKLQIRTIFFAEFGGEDNAGNYREQAIKKISAVYRLMYESDEELGISLPWMFVDLLMSARNWNKNNSVLSRSKALLLRPWPLSNCSLGPDMLLCSCS